MHYRRAARAPVHLRRIAAQVFVPEQLARQVVAIDARHAEVSNQPLAIGRWRLRRIAVVWMNWNSRLTGESRLLPGYISGGRIEAKHLPLAFDVRRFFIAAENRAQNAS